MPLWTGGGGDKGIGVRPMKYEYKPLEVKRGALVVFHGAIRARRVGLRIRTFSIIDGDAECPEDSYMKPVVGDFESL